MAKVWARASSSIPIHIRIYPLTWIYHYSVFILSGSWSSNFQRNCHSVSICVLCCWSCSLVCLPPSCPVRLLRPSLLVGKTSPDEPQGWLGQLTGPRGLVTLECRTVRKSVTISHRERVKHCSCSGEFYNFTKYNSDYIIGQSPHKDTSSVASFLQIQPSPT